MKIIRHDSLITTINSYYLKNIVRILRWGELFAELQIYLHCLKNFPAFLLNQKYNQNVKTLQVVHILRN